MFMFCMFTGEPLPLGIPGIPPGIPGCAELLLLDDRLIIIAFGDVAMFAFIFMFMLVIFIPIADPGRACW